MGGKNLLAEGDTVFVRAVIHDDRNMGNREANSSMSDESSSLKVSHPQPKCIRSAGKHKICIRRFLTRSFP